MTLAVIEAVPAMRAEEVLAMDALLALSLLAARARRTRRPAAAAAGAATKRGGWVTRADGRRELQITSMDELSRALKGGML